MKDSLEGETSENLLVNVVVTEEGADPEFIDVLESDLCPLSKEYGAALARRAAGDLSGAIAAFRSLAERSYNPAQISLGWHFATGDGVPQDTKTARELYKKAADQGFPMANLYWGLLEIAEGRTAEGVALIRTAAEQGDPSALYHFGLLHEQGRGVPVNPQEAIRYYERGADAGGIDAIKGLVRMQLKGHFGIKGFLRAFLYFASAPVFAVRIAKRYRDSPEHVSSDVLQSLGW